MAELKNISGLHFLLAIHGVIVKKDGTSVDVNIGEKPDTDPVFCVTDLLIHLSICPDGQRKLLTVVEGENLRYFSWKQFL